MRYPLPELPPGFEGEHAERDAQAEGCAPAIDGGRAAWGDIVVLEAPPGWTVRGCWAQDGRPLVHFRSADFAPYPSRYGAGVHWYEAFVAITPAGPVAFNPSIENPYEPVVRVDNTMFNAHRQHGITVPAPIRTGGELERARRPYYPHNRLVADTKHGAAMQEWCLLPVIVDAMIPPDEVWLLNEGELKARLILDPLFKA